MFLDMRTVKMFGRYDMTGAVDVRYPQAEATASLARKFAISLEQQALPVDMADVKAEWLDQTDAEAERGIRTVRFYWWPAPMVATFHGGPRDGESWVLRSLHEGVMVAEPEPAPFTPFATPTPTVTGRVSRWAATGFDTESRTWRLERAR